MKYIIALIIVLSLFWLLMIGVEIYGYRGFIKRSTEERYLKEVRSFSPEKTVSSDATWFYTSDGGKYSSVFRNSFSGINPFSKWHIYKGKQIPRWSELHRVLDSMENEYEKAFNPSE